MVRLKVDADDADEYVYYSFNSIVVRLKERNEKRKAEKARGFNSIVVRLKDSRWVSGLSRYPMSFNSIVVRLKETCSPARPTRI